MATTYGSITYGNWTYGAAMPDPRRARLERMLAIDIEPILTSADVDDLLAQSRLRDTCGRRPGDPAWVATYDLNAAAAAGGGGKAGRATANFQFAEDGQSFSPQQVFEHCQAMATLYRARRRGGGSIRIRSGALDDFTSAAAEGIVPLSTFMGYELGRDLR
jgi:hypothetical protein